MKRILLFTLSVVFAMTALAKDIKTLVLTTTPQMHCENCENKIKNNVRFVRGVKTIDTNVEAQTVTITYDADKTTPEKIKEGFAKIGYTVKEVTPDTQSAAQPAQSVAQPAEKGQQCEGAKCCSAK